MRKATVSRSNLRHIERVFQGGIAGDSSDSELLERFIKCGDAVGEAAFAALVERHGPMVLRVCLKALNDRHAAEDAVQVTFLVLARQAGTIRERPSLSSWLFGVALRAAARMRMEDARRRRYEARSAAQSGDLIRAQEAPTDFDCYSELHGEIARLPEKYRVPILLCYFEGLSHEQAAGRLRWPVGTVKIRLSRARERLRTRLERRGRSDEVLLPVGSARPGHFLSLPECLFNKITQTACRSVTAGFGGGLVSTVLNRVTRGVMRSMLFDNLKLAAVVLTGLSLLGFGALAAGMQEKAAPPAGETAIIKRSDTPSTIRFDGATDYDPATVTVIRPPFDCRVDKVLVDLGSNVKTGDLLLELFSVDLAEAKSNYEAIATQWVHDNKLLEYKTALANSGNVAQKELMEAQNNEEQSRLKKKLARDKLLLHGLSKEEIENSSKEDHARKAKLMLRTRGSGVVVKRHAVVGNYYTSADALLTIAQLDRLWVHGNLSERDAANVVVGQKLTVIVPFDDRRVDAKVEYVDSQVDERTGTVKIRTTIPNPQGRLKAGMHVRLAIETDGSHARIDEARGPVEQVTDAPRTDRLSALERKVDLLLGEKEERLSHARILERLDALERKLDQLLVGHR
jgi:RND family efflux transporter MFP subunit